MTSEPPSDCRFCRIAGGELGAALAYEDEHVVAFHDTNPQAPVHVLVIPRRHLTDIAELPSTDPSDVGHIMQGVARVAAIVARPGGYRVVANRGPDAGQTVFHLHFHVLSGRPLGWPPG
jgi:histidine triad (HIT) family protein